MRKKSVTFMICSAMVVLMSLSSAQAGQKLKMSTIAPGTSAYLTMTTMATMINQAQDDITIKVDATGAATKHMVELAQGKIDMCMTNPVVYSFMKNQKVMYKKMKNASALADNLMLLYWFPYGQYHVVTYADAGIRTFEDVRGKRVFLGPPGGGAWAAAKDWFVSAAKLEPHKDFENVKASWSSAFQGFQDRQFDVLVTGGIAPFPQVEQIGLTSKLHLIGLSKEEYQASPGAIEATTKPGREVGIIQKGVYGDSVDNQTDVYSLGSIVGVSVNQSMDPAVAYRLVKIFWEETQKNAATHPWLNTLTKEYAVRNGGMVLHPGAAKYYKEQGLDIPEGSL